MNVPRADPTWQCQQCGTSEVIKPDGRGFPPHIAKKRLIKSCKAKGHECQPRYRVGVMLATRADEQWLKDTYGKSSEELADEAEKGY